MGDVGVWGGHSNTYIIIVLHKQWSWFNAKKHAVFLPNGKKLISPLKLDMLNIQIRVLAKCRRSSLPAVLGGFPKSVRWRDARGDFQAPKQPISARLPKTRKTKRSKLTQPRRETSFRNKHSELELSPEPRHGKKTRLDAGQTLLPGLSRVGRTQRHVGGSS